MKKLPFLLLAILAFTPRAAAQADTVSISGAAQSNRPISVARPFVQGEIANFAQAVIGGTAVLTQCDVKNRWPDGSLKFAIVSFIVPTIPATNSVTVSFQNQTTGNNTGALTQAQMLSTTYNFEAAITLTGATPKMISARTMLSAGAWRPWLQGPIVTAVIIEDRSPVRAYDVDFGDGSKALHPIIESWFYPQNGEVDNGVAIENDWVSSSNAMDERDETYSVSISAGSANPTTVFTNQSFTHVGSTRWQNRFSINAAPVVNVNYNLAYLSSTKAIANYDATITVAPSVVSQWQNVAVTALGGNATGYGDYLYSIAQDGASPWIGLQPTWESVYLFSMDPGLFKTMLLNADLAGRESIMVREGDQNAGTGHFFDSGGTVSTFGRVLSVNARPEASAATLTFSPSAVCSDGAAHAADQINTGTITDSFGLYNAGPTHFPEAYYDSYLLSGRYFYLEGLQMTASYLLGWGQGCSDATYQHYGANGLFYRGEDRGLAWAYRTVENAAFISPDGQPEQAYFIDKLQNNIAVDEGAHNLTLDIPAKTAQYALGQGVFTDTFLNSATNTQTTSPLYLWRSGSCGLVTESGGITNSVGVATAIQPWEQNFLRTVFGYGRDMGLGTGALEQFLAGWALHQLLDPTAGGGPSNIKQYSFPASRLPTWPLGACNDPPPTGSYWEPTWAGIASDMSVSKSWDADGVENPEGYQNIAFGTVSFLYPYTVDGYTGAAAVALMVAQVPSQADFSTMTPKWDIKPRTGAIPPPPPPPPPPPLAPGAPTITGVTVQ